MTRAPYLCRLCLSCLSGGVWGVYHRVCVLRSGGGGGGFFFLGSNYNLYVRVSMCRVSLM